MPAEKVGKVEEDRRQSLAIVSSSGKHVSPRLRFPDNFIFLPRHTLQKVVKIVLKADLLFFLFPRAGSKVYYSFPSVSCGSGTVKISALYAFLCKALQLIKGFFISAAHRVSSILCSLSLLCSRII